MSDTQYKAKTLQLLAPVSPALGSLAPLKTLAWAPVGAVMRAQDTVPATSRRIVAEWSLSGAQDWAQPETTDAAIIAGAVLAPDDTWRELGRFYSHITPGCELRAYAVACPAGKTQEGSAQPTGAWAEVRVGVTWTNSGTSTGPHYKTAPTAGSAESEGDEFDGAGQNFAASQVVDLGRMRPPEYESDPAVSVIYSEWTDATITMWIRGGARLIQFVVFEIPLSHTTLHSNSGLTSVHAMVAGLAPQTPGPMTRYPSGATYQEHRFGTRRTMQVAERQSERLGPRIMHWTCWDETDASLWTQVAANPRTFTAVTYEHLLDSTITTYATTTMGWVVGSAYAQLGRLADPNCVARGLFSAVAVRVTVDASRAVGNGVVRVQCGAYDWVDVTVTGARATYEATGYLEGQAYADHDAPPLVVWGRVLAGGSTLSIYGVSVDFGTWVG